MFKRLLIPLVGYLLLSIFFFSKSFFSSYIAGDFQAYWVPNYHYLISNLKLGIIPAWQPYSYMGLPNFFQPSLAVFYPGISIYILLNFIFNSGMSFNVLGKTLELYQYAHIILGMMGVFLLLKEKLKLSTLSSYLSGIIFGFSLFTTSSLSNISEITGKMLFPWLIFILVEYIEKANLRSFLFLITINYLIFSLGYPYFYLYFFTAELSLACLYGLKSLIRVVMVLVCAGVVAGIFLFPQLHIYLQSSRYQSTNSDTSFHQAYSFIPTRIINILNPQLFKNLYDIRDKQGLFSWGNLNWGIFPLLLLIFGIQTIRQHKLNTWAILMIITGIIYSLGGYMEIPQMLSLFLPFIDKLRSHPQILIISYFSGVMIIGQSIDYILKGLNKSRLNLILWIFSLSMFIILLFTPLYCIDCIKKSSDILISLGQTTVLMFLSLTLIYFINKQKSKLFLIIGIIITIFEYGHYYLNIEYLHQNTAYNLYFKKNSLIPETPTNDNLFRYYFEEDQFSYNTSNISVFNILGYETTPYKAATSLINNPNIVEALKQGNVKYWVTAKEKNSNNSLQLIKTINPTDYPNEVLISSVPSLPYWTSASKNTHYIYKITDTNPRFYGNNTTIDVINYLPNQIELTVSSLDKTTIYSSEIWDKGWELIVNGRSDNLLNNNGFRSFEVPKGTSFVTMSYRPPLMFIGILSSAIGVLGVCIICKRKWYQ